jgi:DNA-binding MarR family transcriptional regulator
MAMDEGPTTGSLVWQLATRWRTQVDRAVAPFGLTHAQYSALASLYVMTHKGLTPSQRDLADFTGLDPIYVSKLVRTLEAGGLVTRTTDPADSRVVRLALSAEGSATIGRAIPVVRDLDRRLTASLGSPKGAKAQALKATLRQLLDEAMQTGDPR